MVAALIESKLMCQMLAMVDRRVRSLFAAADADSSGRSLEQHSDLVDAFAAHGFDLAMSIIRERITDVPQSDSLLGAVKVVPPAGGSTGDC